MKLTRSSCSAQQTEPNALKKGFFGDPKLTREDSDVQDIRRHHKAVDSSSKAGRIF